MTILDYKENGIRKLANFYVLSIYDRAVFWFVVDVLSSIFIMKFVGTADVVNNFVNCQGLSTS